MTEKLSTKKVAFNQRAGAVLVCAIGRYRLCAARDRRGKEDGGRRVRGIASRDLACREQEAPTPGSQILEAGHAGPTT